MHKFWYTKEFNTSFMETLDNIIFSLKEQWFWVLTNIDIQWKIKEKLWRDIPEYVVLWACNPSFASKSLDLEYEIWLLLPCNVIVYSKNSKVFVSTILPTVAMSFINNDELQKLAKEVEEKLIMAVESV